jgi:hypothetical protein
LSKEVAKSLNTPIAVLNVTAEAGTIWKSQCGLPADLASGLEAFDSSIAKGKSTVVIEDIVNDHGGGGSPLDQLRGPGYHLP